MAQLTALLVEDNADDTYLIERTLRQYQTPIEVATAKDGVEAIGYLFGNPHSAVQLPSFVVLDLNLPRLSGMAVLKRIRAERSTRRLPVIILSSSPDERDVADSYSNGANTYLAKPLNSQKLAAAIENLDLSSTRPGSRPAPKRPLDPGVRSSRPPGTEASNDRL